MCSHFYTVHTHLLNSFDTFTFHRSKQPQQPDKVLPLLPLWYPALVFSHRCRSLPPLKAALGFFSCPCALCRLVEPRETSQEPTLTQFPELSELPVRHRVKKEENRCRFVSKLWKTVVYKYKSRRVEVHVYFTRAKSRRISSAKKLAQF